MEQGAAAGYRVYTGTPTTGEDAGTAPTDEEIAEELQACYEGAERLQGESRDIAIQQCEEAERSLEEAQQLE